MIGGLGVDIFHLFTPQMATMTMIGTGQSQETGISSSSPMCAQGPKYLTIFNAFPRAQTGSHIGKGMYETQT